MDILMVNQHSLMGVQRLFYYKSKSYDNLDVITNQFYLCILI